MLPEHAEAYLASLKGLEHEVDVRAGCPDAFLLAHRMLSVVSQLVVHRGVACQLDPLISGQLEECPPSLPQVLSSLRRGTIAHAPWM